MFAGFLVSQPQSDCQKLSFSTCAMQYAQAAYLSACRATDRSTIDILGERSPLLSNQNIYGDETGSNTKLQQLFMANSPQNETPLNQNWFL